RVSEPGSGEELPLDDFNKLSAPLSLRATMAFCAFFLSSSIDLTPLPNIIPSAESNKHSKTSTVSTLYCFNILITHDGGRRASTGSLSNKGFLAATLLKPKLFNMG